MLKKLFTTLPFLFIASLIIGQNVSLSPSPALATGDPIDIRKATATLTNHTDSDIVMWWTRTTNDLPPLWLSAVCDPNQCYAAEDNEPSTSFTLFANSDTLVFVQFDARNRLNDTPPFEYDPVEGDATVEVCFYAIEDSAATNAKGVFDAELRFVDGIEDYYKDLILVYPNPANDILNVELPADVQPESMEIYDIKGSLVKQVPNPKGTNVSINLSGISSGNYFLRTKNQDGQTLANRRFYKE